MGQFRSVGHRILFVVGLFLLFGFTAVSVVYLDQQEKSILKQNETDLIRVTQSTANGLQSIMSRGYAGIGHRFSSSLKLVPNVLDYRVLRVDGSEAFADNRTVQEVNAKLGSYEFKERRFTVPAQQVRTANDPLLRQAGDSGKAAISYDRRSDGERTATVIDPILGDASCSSCHDPS